MSEVKDLQNIIKINGASFNINAVHSNSAAKVDNALTIEQNGNSQQGRETITFDGTAQKELSVVPSEGGTYSGPVFIENNTLEAAEDNQVLTYANIEQLTEQLTGFSCYSWDGTSLSSKNGSNEPLGKASLIVGPTDCIELLKSYMISHQIDDGTPTYWLYLNSDMPHNIYLCSKEETIQLALAAEKLVYHGVSTDTTPIDIEWTAKGISDKFKDLDLADNTSQLSINLDKLGTFVKKIAGVDRPEDVDKSLVNIKGTLDDIINGDIAVGLATDATNAVSAKNADSAKKATSADSATKATNDEDSYNIAKGYYRSTANSYTSYNNKANTITISNNAPSGGNPGDIWIKIP